MMRTVKVNGTIRRPVKDVFGVLSNPENAPRWSSNALEEKLTSDGPVGVGSTRRAVVKTLFRGSNENHAVCTAFEPDRRIAWRATSAPVLFAVTVDVVPIDGGTRIESIWTWEAKGFLRPIGFLVDVMFKRAMLKDVNHLAALMEAGEL